jgi:hypothetical protein
VAESNLVRLVIALVTGYVFAAGISLLSVSWSDAQGYDLRTVAHVSFIVAYLGAFFVLFSLSSYTQSLALATMLCGLSWLSAWWLGMPL